MSGLLTRLLEIGVSGSWAELSSEVLGLSRGADLVRRRSERLGFGSRIEALHGGVVE